MWVNFGLVVYRVWWKKSVIEFSVQPGRFSTTLPGSILDRAAVPRDAIRVRVSPSVRVRSFPEEKGGWRWKKSFSCARFTTGPPLLRWTRGRRYGEDVGPRCQISLASGFRFFAFRLFVKRRIDVFPSCLLQAPKKGTLKTALPVTTEKKKVRFVVLAWQWVFLERTV